MAGDARRARGVPARSWRRRRRARVPPTTQFVSVQECVLVCFMCLFCAGKVISKRERDAEGLYASSLVYGEIAYSSFGTTLEKIRAIYGAPGVGASGDAGVMQRPGCDVFYDLGQPRCWRLFFFVFFSYCFVFARGFFFSFFFFFFFPAFFYLFPDALSVFFERKAPLCFGTSRRRTGLSVARAPTQALGRASPRSRPRRCGPSAHASASRAGRRLVFLGTV